MNEYTGRILAGKPSGTVSMSDFRGKGGTYVSSFSFKVKRSPAGSLGTDTKGGSATEYVSSAFTNNGRETTGATRTMYGGTYRNSPLIVFSYGADDSFWIYMQPSTASVPKSWFQRITINGPINKRTFYTSSASGFLTNGAGGTNCYWFWNGISALFSENDVVTGSIIS
jgi:hypothetical protein